MVNIAKPDRFEFEVWKIESITNAPKKKKKGQGRGIQIIFKFGCKLSVIFYHKNCKDLSLIITFWQMFIHLPFENAFAPGKQCNILTDNSRIYRDLHRDLRRLVWLLICSEQEQHKRLTTPQQSRTLGLNSNKREASSQFFSSKNLYLDNLAVSREQQEKKAESTIQR